MNFVPKAQCIQVDTQCVPPQDPIIFQTDLSSLDLFCRGNMMEQTLDVTLTLPVSVGLLPRGRVLGPLPLKNDLQPSTFKQCVLTF